MDAVQLPAGPDNPAGMGFVAQETKLSTTAKAQRTVNFDAARIWKVRDGQGRLDLDMLTAGYFLLFHAPPLSGLIMLAIGTTRALFAAIILATCLLCAGVQPQRDQPHERVPCGLQAGAHALAAADGGGGQLHRAARGVRN